MTNQFLISPLGKQKKLTFRAPNSLIEKEYELWASVLLQRTTWISAENLAQLKIVPATQHLFVASLLCCSKLFYELGGMPIFDTPRIISFSEDNEIANKFEMEIELPIVQLISEEVYDISLNNAFLLCRWMAENQLSFENKHKVFDTITNKVIMPLRGLVPGGQSTIPILKVAHSLNIPFYHIGAGAYQLGWGSKARRLERSTCDYDSAIGAKLVQNKILTANILRNAGLPSPVHKVATQEIDAITIAKKIGFPVVIKPIDCDRGEGISVNVTDNDAVKLAFIKAYNASKAKQVIIERQVPGLCHRLFIANRELLYAVKRLPMSVMGDGQRTIIQLIDDEVSLQKDKAPWFQSKIKPLDERAIKSLLEAGYTPQSVPSQGTWVPLRAIESTADGGVDEEVTGMIHPDNLSAALFAANLFGLHIAGIDIISPDISKPWHANGAIINEVNFAPLFGGGEISRSYIPKFFDKFIEGDGRIPIVGFKSEHTAIARQKAYLKNGVRCYFTSSKKTVDFNGKILSMPLDNLQNRLKALIYRNDVDAITFCATSSDIRK